MNWLICFVLIGFWVATVSGMFVLNCVESRHDIPDNVIDALFFVVWLLLKSILWIPIALCEYVVDKILKAGVYDNPFTPVKFDGLSTISRELGEQMIESRTNTIAVSSSVSGTEPELGSVGMYISMKAMHGKD